MTTTSHLQLIRFFCLRNLELAKARTPGRWHHNDYRATIQTRAKSDPPSVPNTVVAIVPNGNSGVLPKVSPHDATFMAACAGAAEAGWRATIATVDAILATLPAMYIEMDCDYAEQNPFVLAILSAYPLDLIQ